MTKSIFEITKMDCPAEENLIRLKLSPIDKIQKLTFDIQNRRLTIIHDDQLDLIQKSISELNLNEELLSSEITEDVRQIEEGNQRKLLWVVLAINVLFFVLEMVTGMIAESMGLVADSLDMLADSFVYGLSIFAVGGGLIRKKKIAKLAGYFQIVLAIFGFIEVVRRFLEVERTPDFSIMIMVSILALIGNGLCLYLLNKSKSKEAHMRASMIFTSNDVIINLGVIIAGVLVEVLNSNKPDLIIGTIVFIFVIQGAIRILKLSK